MSTTVRQTMFETFLMPSFVEAFISSLSPERRDDLKMMREGLLQGHRLVYSDTVSLHGTSVYIYPERMMVTPYSGVHILEGVVLRGGDFVGHSCSVFASEVLGHGSIAFGDELSEERKRFYGCGI